MFSKIFARVANDQPSVAAQLAASPRNTPPSSPHLNAVDVDGDWVDVHRRAQSNPPFKLTPSEPTTPTTSTCLESVPQMNAATANDATSLSVQEKKIYDVDFTKTHTRPKFCGDMTYEYIPNGVCLQINSGTGSCNARMEMDISLEPNKIYDVCLKTIAYTTCNPILRVVEKNTGDTPLLGSILQEQSVNYFTFKVNSQDASAVNYVFSVEFGPLVSAGNNITVERLTITAQS